MTTAVLYAILCGAGYYLAARAKITRWLWSHYPSWLDDLAMCASCTGWWLGLGCGALGWWLELPLLGLDPQHWFTVVSAGLGGIIWTPLVIYPVLIVLEGLSEDPTGADKSNNQPGAGPRLVE